MAFEEKPLSTTIDWENVEKNRVRMIYGQGQAVYWRGCNVTVYEKDSEGNDQTRMLVSMPNGEGLIQPGDKLYVTHGQVTEKVTES
ncbi:hypothetical protein BU26DRAFT_522306 [Trematosphaeria pertusa]|uniref:Uncharacterized protein n=1 Tax=Trematosphaeria pertusa TaxID=390896 RepID=A0A6A6I4H5_9PLEO|nr:uncharacterized protein BU26DRAFT_522306 [Trematosphaeria pertusa]KAF2245207.1 hypothetical protein BU26DRAFT_522306 [Trematosphaeria pertusa]